MSKKFGNYELNILCEIYGVTSEKELTEKLMEDANNTKIPCVFCHREYSIDQLIFVQGDPVCKKCK